MSMKTNIIIPTKFLGMMYFCHLVQPGEDVQSIMQSFGVIEVVSAR